MSLPDELPDRLEVAARDGSERAGGALSSLLGRPVEVRHHDARVVAPGGEHVVPGDGMAIGRLSVEGGNDLHGEAVVALSAQSVRELMATYELPLQDDGTPDEVGLSMLREVSNITASSYLNALADAWDMELLPSPVDVQISGDGGDLALPGGPAPAVVFRCEFASEGGIFEVALVTCIDTSRIPSLGGTA